MRVLGHLPLDAVFKTLLGRLARRGHDVRSTMSFGDFRRALPWADVVLMNYTKNDAPRYTAKVLASALASAFARRPLMLFFSVDPVDLCDRPIQRLFLGAVNLTVTTLSARVGVLRTRTHILDRYAVPAGKRFEFENYPDRALWAGGDEPALPPVGSGAGFEGRPAEHRQGAVADAGAPVGGRGAGRGAPGPAEEARRRVDAVLARVAAERAADPRTIVFLYHGELLWWHGLELFEPVARALEEQGSRPLVIVAGHLYDSVFRCLGLAGSRREAAVKLRLGEFLRRPWVVWLGRVPQAEVRRLMAVSDFHLTQLRGGARQAETERRTCLLEAMAAGMVCVHRPTRAVGGPPFCDGGNIVLAPAAPRTAAQRLVALHRDAAARRAIGRAAALTVARHFDLDGWVVEIEGLMRRIASASTRPR
ncbi:MAG: hypothetical protein Kow0059_21040 [Candidatus Sumerlaeia bacterium]